MKKNREAPETADSNSPDTESIDAIVTALYDSISGSKGETRDWERFRALFHPDARMIPSSIDDSGVLTAKAFTPEGYIQRTEGFLVGNGFFEKEVARRTLVFGGIAHVFSTYEGRNDESDEEPFLRGINSIQLLHDGDRWWVMTVFWQPESPGVALPDKFLKGS